MTDRSFQVMVLENDPETLNLLDDVLTDEGCWVDSMTSGVDVLTHLKENRPDLIIASADLESPNGLEICYRTKRIKRLKTVPVLILASRDDDHLRDHATLAQADLTLIRPLEREAVREIVRQLLTRSALGGLDTSDIDPRGTLILNMDF
jgi:two-component system, chemotaxis family, response regulator PixG